MWSLLTDTLLKSIQKIQYKFCTLLTVFYGARASVSAYSNEEVCRYLKFNSLVERRIVANLIDAPDINECFEFSLAGLDPRRNWLLKTEKINKNYFIYGPHNRIANLINSLHSQVNCYGGSYASFRFNIKNHVLKYN